MSEMAIFQGFKMKKIYRIFLLTYSKATLSEHCACKVNKVSVLLQVLKNMINYKYDLLLSTYNSWN